MGKKNSLHRIIPWTIFPITLFSILSYPKTTGSILSVINITTLWWVIIALVYVAYFSYFIQINSRLSSSYKKTLLPIYLYLAWNIIEIIYGLLVAESYWDYKGLISNVMALLLPISIFVFSIQPSQLALLLNKYIRYCLPAFALVVLLVATDAYGFYLVPLTLILFFLPILEKKWVIIILAFTVLILAADLGARSNVIKFVVPLLFLSVYYLRILLTNNILQLGRQILLIIPFILFFLGVTGIFNVFKMNEYIEGDYKVERTSSGNVVEDNLTADTRTFLYEEVLLTAKKYDTWLLGRSPARGNDTSAFADWAKAITGKAERLGNEVAILNIFTWTGSIGVFLYFFVFYRASYLAISKSKNIYITMLGLFTAFRWAYAWVEDVNNFSLNYFMLWIIIGMCYSKAFRQMNNLQMKYWVRGIFDVKYRNLLYSYNNPTNKLVDSTNSLSSNIEL